MHAPNMPQKYRALVCVLDPFYQDIVQTGSCYIQNTSALYDMICVVCEERADVAEIVRGPARSTLPHPIHCFA
jgi:hypothetical protein